MPRQSQSSSCRHAPIGVALSTVVAACVGTSAFAQSQIVAWGRGDNGQTTPGSRTLLGCRVAAAGLDHTIVLRNDGSVAAWGLNTSGQTSVPSNLGTVVRIAGGGKHSMALTAQGVVKCWGDNLDFGPCPGCPTDLDGTGEVDTSDLALLLLLFD